MRPQVTFAEPHVVVTPLETAGLHFYQVCWIAGQSVLRCLKFHTYCQNCKKSIRKSPGLWPSMFSGTVLLTRPSSEEGACPAINIWGKKKIQKYSFPVQLHIHAAVLSTVWVSEKEKVFCLYSYRIVLGQIFLLTPRTSLTLQSLRWVLLLRRQCFQKLDSVHSPRFYDLFLIVV